MKSTNEKVTKTIYIYIIFCKRVISLSRDIYEKYGSICICMYSCHLFICSWMVVHVWEQSSYIEEVDNQDFVTNFIVFNLWEKLTEHIHFDLNERMNCYTYPKLQYVVFVLQYETKVMKYEVCEWWSHKDIQNLFFKDIFLFFIKESCHQIWTPVWKMWVHSM